MKLYNFLLTGAALLTLSGCEQNSNGNRADGVKDAIDARPNEGIRDLGEDIGDAVKDVGRDIKKSINDN